MNEEDKETPDMITWRRIRREMVLIIASISTLGAVLFVIYEGIVVGVVCLTSIILFFALTMLWYYVHLESKDEKK